MKNKIFNIFSVIIIIFSLFSLCSLFIAYRLGYCNGCDKYINASECKPKRKLNFMGD